MKVLIFGDGPQLKEAANAFREQNGGTVHARSIKRWAGDVEKADEVYFLTPAEPIRKAYNAHGIKCFLVEENGDEDDGADKTDGSAASEGREETENASGDASEKSDVAAPEKAPGTAGKLHKGTGKRGKPA